MMFLIILNDKFVLSATKYAEYMKKYWFSMYIYMYIYIHIQGLECGVVI